MNKKGFDKPIEIFVALFIILAVAAVVLKMFAGQILSTEEKIAAQQRIEKIKSLKNDAKTECNGLCSDAMQSDCDTSIMVKYCIHYFDNKGKGMDVDQNGIDYDDRDLFSVFGGCEDRVYCFNLKSCECGAKLTEKECVRIICSYFNEKVNDLNLLNQNL